MSTSAKALTVEYGCGCGCLCGCGPVFVCGHSCSQKCAGMTIEKSYWQCVMSHTNTEASEWVTPHVWMSHVARMNESCHTYEWVMSHIWRSHGIHMNAICHRMTTLKQPTNLDPRIMSWKEHRNTLQNTAMHCNTRITNGQRLPTN